MSVSTLVAFSNPMDEGAAGAVYAMPATPPQVRLWNLEQANGPDPRWNVAVRFRLTGALDRDNVEAALQSLVARHEVLRTSLEVRSDAIVQRIAPRATLPVEWCDLRALDQETRETEVLRLSLEHARQPFSLSLAPLFRVRLLRLSDSEHVLLWNASTAICDGWSVGVLAAGFMESYGALQSGIHPANRSSLDYGDYAVWLEAQRQTREYQAHGDFWKRNLQGSRAAELPDSWHGANDRSATASIHSILLPRQLTNRLTALAQRHDATFFHVALAVFAVLMRSAQQTNDVAVGSPVSGREQAELETVAGNFVNYLPLHLRVATDQPFSDVVKSVRDRATDALEHAGFRFEDILAQHAPSSAVTADAHSLFSSVFICQQDFVRPVIAGGLTLTALPSVSPGALFPLTVFLVERADGWRLSCEVDGDNVSATRGAEIIETFATLADTLAADPDEPVHAAAPELFAATDRADVFAGESGNVASADITRRVPATESQVRFWMLDRVNPGDTSFDLTIRLDIAGPLDQQALRSAVEDVTERNEILRTTLEEEDGRVWQVIHPHLDVEFKFQQSRQISAQGDEEVGSPFSLTCGPLFRVRLDQFAPDHFQLTITLSHAIADGWSSGAFLEQLQQDYEQHVSKKPAAPRLSVSQFASYAAAEQELLASTEKDRRLAWWKEHLAGTWLPLELPRDIQPALNQDAGPGPGSHAGIVCNQLAPGAVLSARHFARDNDATVFAVFGAVFQALLARYSGKGEILFLTPFANRNEDTERILGPLAVPVCLTARIAPGTTFRQLVSGLSSQSLDAIDHVLPFSLVAPLIDIRVAAGRHPLNQISFFHQRAFVHDMEWGNLHVRPLAEVPSAGGSEWQLGVIERNEGTFAEFQYDARFYSPETMSLVGRHYARLLSHAVLEPDLPISRLQFMVEEEISPESTGAPVLPLTRRLLTQTQSAPRLLDAEPAPVAEEPLAIEPAGRNAEQAMIRIWRQIFRTEAVDAGSDFFDLGGHSLLLARLQIAVKKEFNVQLTAADVFRHSSLGKLVEWLERAREADVIAANAQNNPRIIPIQPVGAGRPLFVISQSMIFRTMAAELGEDQPVYALQLLDEDIETAMLSADFDELVNFYLRLLRSVQPTGPYRLAGWCVSGWLAYGVARQLELQNETVELLMVMDAWAPGYWRHQPRGRHALMQAVYRWQRFRWVARRLSNCTSEQRSAYIRRSLHGMAAAAARNLTVRLHRMHLPVQVRLTEEMRRGEQLEYTATRSYDPGPLKGTVLVFRSEEQPTGPLLARDMGWSKMLERPITVEQLPGDHHEIFDLPGARMMAMRARAVLRGSAEDAVDSEGGSAGGGVRGASVMEA